MNNNLQKLEEILKKCIDMGWRPFNNDLIELNISDTTLIIKMKDDSGVMEYLVNFNDIFSVESGLLQFVKGKESSGYIKRVSYRGKNKMVSIANYNHWQYHAMQMSILPVDQKIEYFINNIDI